MLSICQQHTKTPLFAVGNNWVSDGPMIFEVIKRGGAGLMINCTKQEIYPEVWQGSFEELKSHRNGAEVIEI